MIQELTILAFLIVCAVFPVALRIAKKYHIEDQPDARKLQHEPVPVFGSVAVVMGMLVPMATGALYFDWTDLWYSFAAILLLFVIGLADDIRGLSAVVRFLIEMLLVWVLIWHPFQINNGPMIDSMHGLFGREAISSFTAIPLSIIAGVGLVNAINLIDGVDGYSSGFGVVSNVLFAVLFFHCGLIMMGFFALVTAASLVPFYMHNVFGKKSKMFIGDGGSLVIGLVLATNTLTLLSTQSDTSVLREEGVGLIPLSLAILCVPVFDTLRVMVARVCEGRSPFSPDKTHLHHLFIDMGFSHVGTSSTIIGANLLIVLAWYIAWMLGVGVFGQFVLVVVLGLLMTSVFYYGMRHAQKRNSRWWGYWCRFGRWTHFENKGIWNVLQQLVDATAFTK